LDTGFSTIDGGVGVSTGTCVEVEVAVNVEVIFGSGDDVEAAVLIADGVGGQDEQCAGRSIKPDHQPES